MLAKARNRLRLHIEAVWGVQLPELTQDECELLPAGEQPEWRLYVAELEATRLYIWRPDVSIDQRAQLRKRAQNVLDLAMTPGSPADVAREVALAFEAPPTLDLASARRLAHSLTKEEQTLLDQFQDESSGLLSATRRPLIGVIEGGRLVCLAHSARRTEDACELGIDTLPEARRKGYALAATIVWTQAILQEGFVPFYSALAENTPSLRLAATAGYRVFARGATLK